MRRRQGLVLVIIIAAFSLLFPQLSKELNIPSQDILSEITQNAPTPTISKSPSQILSPQNGEVVKVVDGDTFDVYLNGQTQRVRVIGINTPETVDPRRPIECFGRQASDYAKSLLSEKIVILEQDPSQSNMDRYGRILRYVTLPDKTDFGLQMIKNGYAYEYTYENPYQKQKEYKEAQTQAEIEKLGLWGDNTCN